MTFSPDLSLYYYAGDFGDVLRRHSADLPQAYASHREVALLLHQLVTDGVSVRVTSFVTPAANVTYPMTGVESDQLGANSALIQPGGGRFADALGACRRGRCRRRSPVVDSVSVAAELDGDLVDDSATPADLFGVPPASPLSQRPVEAPRSSAPERSTTDRALVARACPTMLVPQQAELPAERRQIDQLDHITVLDHRRPPAAITTSVVRRSTRCAQATGRRVRRRRRARQRLARQLAVRTCR